MPLQQPTLQQLKERALSDIESRLPGSQPRLGTASLLGIIAQLHAEAVFGHYSNQAWIARQIHPHTADAGSLDDYALWRTGLIRASATRAVGSATFTGTNGAVIPGGTQLQAADGTRYTTDAEASITAGTVTTAVTAELAGAAGNQVAGLSLSLVTPIAGVNSQASVAAPGLTGGAAAESDERLRARILDALQHPAQGGSLQNYVSWALAAHPSVTNAWVEENAMGIGTVTVRIMTYDATANGIPTQTVLDAVAAYIDVLRPAGLKGFYVVAPIADVLNFTIAGLSPNTQAVKDAVAAELADLLRREAEPGGTLRLSRIREAISIATGEQDHVLTSPTADIVSAAGHIAIMGAITWA